MTKRAGRRPRFSSASWMPLARCSISRIRSVAQATLAASSRGVLPHRRRARCRCRPRRCRPCPGARCGLGRPSSSTACATAPAGIVSAIRRRPGSSSSTGGVGPHVVDRVAVLVGVGRVRRRRRGRSSATGDVGHGELRPLAHRAGLEQRQRLARLGARRREHRPGHRDLELALARRGGRSASAPSSRGTRGPISCAQRKTSSSTSIG